MPNNLIPEYGTELIIVKGNIDTTLMELKPVTTHEPGSVIAINWMVDVALRYGTSLTLRLRRENGVVLEEWYVRYQRGIHQTRARLCAIDTHVAPRYILTATKTGRAHVHCAPFAPKYHEIRK